MATRLKIPAFTICDHAHYSDEAYGDWNESHTFEVGDTAIILPEDGKYVYTGMGETELYEGDLAEGDIIFVVIANYSGGDSFGWANNKYVDVCSINKDSNIAYYNLKALGSKKPIITLDDGTTHSYYRSWDGYFESLDSLEVYTMIVKKYDSGDEYD